MREKKKAIKAKSNNKCLRCGACCSAVFKFMDNWIPCPYLVKDKNGRCTCSIYHKRLGDHTATLILEGKPVIVKFRCILRAYTYYDFPGCPYNSGKPTHPKYL